jgi:hypothetical protein
MNRIIVLSLLFFMVSLPLRAQQFRAGAMAGRGSYTLDDLKELQMQSLRSTYRLFSGVKSMHQFPDYYNWMGWMEYKEGTHSVGIDYSYLFTGARNHLADYSGTYTLDLLINTNRFALFYKFWFFGGNEINKFMLYSQLRLGLANSSLSLREDLEIYNIDELSYHKDYTSTHRFYELGLGVVYRINKYFDVNLSVGYEGDSPNKLRIIGDMANYLKDNQGETVLADWSGFRIRIGAGISLGK